MTLLYIKKKTIKQIKIKRENEQLNNNICNTDSILNILKRNYISEVKGNTFFGLFIFW